MIGFRFKSKELIDFRIGFGSLPLGIRTDPINELIAVGRVEKNSLNLIPFASPAAASFLENFFSFPSWLLHDHLLSLKLFLSACDCFFYFFVSVSGYCFVFFLCCKVVSFELFLVVKDFYLYPASFLHPLFQPLAFPHKLYRFQIWIGTYLKPIRRVPISN